MTNLAIILLGQVRTFFTKHGCIEFLRVVDTSLNHYEKIYISVVISGVFDKDKIDWFKLELDKRNVFHNTILFDVNDSNKLTQEKIKNREYLEIKSRYLNINNYAKKEIWNVDNYLKKAAYQFHQLSIGIKDIIEFENNNNIKFLCMMKTRFDVSYHNNFYPVYATEDSPIEDKLLVNNHIKDIFKNKYHIDITSNEFLLDLKSKKIIHPNCRVREDHFSTSLGGAYLYNWASLENIKNGDNNILYCFNDHVLFGKRDVFLKLNNLIYSYGIIRTDLNINHFYAEESQLLMFCIENKINPLMYLDKDIHDIIR